MNDEEQKDVEEFKTKFWDHHSLPFAKPSLATFYSNNVARWLKNAHALRADFPSETNQFLAYIYASDFSFKLVWNYSKFHKYRKRYSLQDKVDFLNNAFEHGYQHFALLTFCENYSTAYVGELCKKWFVPDIAREYTKNPAENPWKNGRGDFISGKKWILGNCPFHREWLNECDIDLLYLIKNAKSHEKMAIIADKIIILENNSQRIVSSKEIDKLFSTMQYAVNLSMNFNLILAIRHNFWFAPALILANPSRFQFPERKSPPFDKLKTVGEKVKNKQKKPGGELIIYRTAIVIYCACEYFFHFLWDKILSDKVATNAFLDIYSFRLDEEKLQQLYDYALFDSFSFLIESTSKLRNLLKIEMPTDLQVELNKHDVRSFDYRLLLHEMMKMVVFIKDSEDKKLKYRAFFEIGMSFLISFINMSGNLGEALNSAYQQKSAVVISENNS